MFQIPIKCNTMHSRFIDFFIAKEEYISHRDDGPSYYDFMDDNNYNSFLMAWEQFGEIHRDPLDGAAYFQCDNGEITETYMVNGEVVDAPNPY